MNAAEWGVALGAVTLVVTVPTLLLMLIQEFRSRDRADVEWQVERLSQGTFKVTNVGADAAHGVSVEMWTRSELEKTHAKKVSAGEHVTLQLPHRAAHGPDPVEDLPQPYPRPAGIPVPQEIIANLDRMAREAEQSQVQVKLVWRTRWGNWRTETTYTG